MTLVDTGPIVANLDRSDRHRQWALEALQSTPGPLTTCEAVLTEACFMVRHWPAVIDALIEQVETGRLRLEPMASEASALRALMKKYRDVPMSYADACLVRLTERHHDCVLLTLDRDFDVYRRNGRQMIPLIAPFRGPRR